MKTAYMIFACSALIFSIEGVYAQTQKTVTVTDEQRSAFSTVAAVAKNDYSVPQMIDVPLSFGDDMKEIALVTDSSGMIIPSTITMNTQYQSLQYTVTDSFDTAHMQNIVDGAYDTFVDFPFVEDRVTEKDVDAVSANNVVEIDLKASRAFTTDTISLQFGAYVSRPTYIRIATVDEAEKEKVVLAKRAFSGNTINFPQEHARHYRVTLTYDKPLRISEITFSEKGIPQTVERFVRFIAAPQTAYDVYFNAQESVKIPAQEMPNFSAKKNVVMVQPVSVLQNSLYKSSDGDGDGISDRDDNCDDVSNSDQQDKDGNAIGDACEDFDQDGVINAKDNCPDAPNRAQDDVDRDGVGDKCDGMEDRFIERHPWIPSATLLVVFVIVVLLIVKTFKQNGRTI